MNVSTLFYISLFHTSAAGEKSVEVPVEGSLGARLILILSALFLPQRLGHDTFAVTPWTLDVPPFLFLLWIERNGIPHISHLSEAICDRCHRVCISRQFESYSMRELLSPSMRKELITLWCLFTEMQPVRIGV
jgi:hypothetical protein